MARQRTYSQRYEPVVKVEIIGIAQANRNMKTLELKIQKKILRRAGAAGAKPIVKRAKQYAPSDTGNFRKTIRYHTRIKASQGRVLTVIKPRATKGQKAKGIDPWFAHIIIGGAKAHDIPTRGTRQGRAVKRPMPDFGVHPYSVIHHPGIRANDFMWRAAQATAKESIAAYTKKYASEVNAAVKELPLGHVGRQSSLGFDR